MSLIKAIDASGAQRVRTVFARPEPDPVMTLEPEPEPSPAVTIVDPRLLDLERQVEDLQGRLTGREDDIARLGREMAKAVEEARAEALREGRVEGEERRREALEVLAAGIDRAIAAAASEREELQRLAVRIAREAVARLVGDVERQSELVTDLVKHQLTSPEAESVVRIDVSPLDFPDDDALAELQAASGRPRVEVLAIPGLDRGDCLMRLGLGVLDVGLQQQWGRLSVVLDELAGQGEG